VDRGSKVFWFLVIVLAGASIFFVSGVMKQTREAKKDELALQSGDTVSLAQVVDGDSVVVKNDSGSTAPVRILGIKTFDTTPERDPAARYGKEAIAAISEIVGDVPIRVLVHTTPKDKHGRTLATLYVGTDDVGMTLVSRGLALVYTQYPFPSMAIYLQEQHKAQADKQGIWADPEMTKRALSLQREWRSKAE
jgi:endonuclease YncB( thermonuclease family)